MIRLEKFDSSAYATLISWIDSEEMLMQFGGPLFTFPLTADQLDRSLADKNRFAFSVIDAETNERVGHCEIFLTETSAKLGRIIVGKKENRGKGYGGQIINALIDFVLRHLDRTRIELNVFDFNTGAIRCYENAGFKINPAIKLERKVGNQTWTAINMVWDTACPIQRAQEQSFRTFS